VTEWMVDNTGLVILAWAGLVIVAIWILYRGIFGTWW